MQRLPESVRNSLSVSIIQHTLAGSAQPSRGCLVGFNMQHQEQDMWCWAAVGVSVDDYYTSHAGGSQCSLVNAELGRSDCCGPSGASVSCNQPWHLEGPLGRLGHYDHTVTGPVSFGQVDGELSASRPVGARVRWTDGSAHFVVIWCCASNPAGTEQVSISDPFYGPWDGPYTAFVNNYRGLRGKWSHTYFTRR